MHVRKTKLKLRKELISQPYFFQFIKCKGPLKLKLKKKKIQSNRYITDLDTMKFLVYRTKKDNFVLNKDISQVSLNRGLTVMDYCCGCDKFIFLDNIWQLL